MRDFYQKPCFNYKFIMFLFKKVADLQQYLNTKRKEGNVIGFVPTMGALHEGHLSLIRASKSQSDLTVCSIFVNPTQFNDVSDLEKYPRTIGADIDLLSSADNDILFWPLDTEVYPPGLDTNLELDFGDLATVMEGYFRPGHFDGMAQVVWRLLQIVEPHKLFMGQKDFQQLTIVRNMLQQMQSEIELIMCPIVREDNGLAMSSRNRRLSVEDRSQSTIIYQVLNEAKEKMKQEKPGEISQWAMKKISDCGYKPEYFKIVNGITLQAIDQFKDADLVVACTAVWVGEVRLIDNMILKNQG